MDETQRLNQAFSNVNIVCRKYLCDADTRDQIQKDLALIAQILKKYLEPEVKVEPS